MIANDTYMLDGTREELAVVLRCRVSDLTDALPNLKSSGVGDVTIASNGRVTLESRRLKREQTDRKNAAVRVTRYREKQKCNGPNTSVSVSASVSDPLGGGGAGEEVRKAAQKVLDASVIANYAQDIAQGRVPWGLVEKWLKFAQENGADYTKDEARSAWLGFEANGWMWGQNPIIDFRAAVEKTILGQRQRNQKSGINGADKVILKGDYDRIIHKIDSMKGRYEGRSFSAWSAEDKVEFERLRKRRQEIKSILGLTV